MTNSEKVQRMIEIRCTEHPEFIPVVREYGILFEEGMPAWEALLKMYRERYELS